MPTMYSLIEDLANNDIDPSIPVYFDTSSLRQFQLWAKNNQDLYEQLIQRIKDEKLQIVWFDWQLKKRPLNYSKSKGWLDTIKFSHDIENIWVTDYEVYTTELQSIYFHDENTGLKREHAEFLALVRHLTHTDDLYIMTDHPAFSRVLNAQIYLLSKPARLGLPPNINIFLDLDMHETLLKATSGYFYNGEYSTSVFEAAKELFEKIRHETNKKSDGTTLINETIKTETQYDSKNGTQLKAGTRPYYELNALSNGDEISEQAAYYNFLLGVTNLIRNTNAHNPASDPFMKRLFSDQKTVIKMLGFLSLLFEKVDKGTL